MKDHIILKIGKRYKSPNFPGTVLSQPDHGHNGCSNEHEVATRTMPGQNQCPHVWCATRVHKHQEPDHVL